MTDVLYQAIDSLIPRDWREWTAINRITNRISGTERTILWDTCLDLSLVLRPGDAPVQVQWVERLTQIQPNVPGLLPLFHWCIIWGTQCSSEYLFGLRRKGKVDFLCRCLVSYPLSPHPPFFAPRCHLKEYLATAKAEDEEKSLCFWGHRLQQWMKLVRNASKSCALFHIVWVWYTHHMKNQNWWDGLIDTTIKWK